MESYFASPERSDEKQLSEEIALINKSEIINQLLKIVSSLLVVLDETRQIVAVNDALLKQLSIDKIEDVLGARPGEAINCIHAHDMIAGCGTSKFCSSCGAAVAIVTSLAKKITVEKNCFISIEKGGEQKDIYFKVKASILKLEDKNFVLLFIQDITRYNLWGELEKSFFNDINDYITTINGIFAVYDNKNEIIKKKMIEKVKQYSFRLKKEIDLQRTLIHDEVFLPNREKVDIKQIISELKVSIKCNNFSKDKYIAMMDETKNISFDSDINLILKILINMILNALEVTVQGKEVKLIVEKTKKELIFKVWNQGVISKDVAMRIFQRHFSTKDEIGRGFGTYLMKLFGEKFLGGKVGFDSNKEDGTTFWFKLPL